MKKTFLILTIITTVTVAGCAAPKKTAQTKSEQQMQKELAQKTEAEKLASSATQQQKFTEHVDESRSAVDSALAWSHRYEQLSGKYEKLLEERDSFGDENAKLKVELAQVRMELEQTNHELSQANEFIKEMNIELSNWKREVLGNREHIEKAHEAQLKALLKILRILGAETSDE